jgi:hypothetical protein
MGVSMTWGKGTAPILVMAGKSETGHVRVDPGPTGATPSARFTPVIGDGAHVCGGVPSLPAKAHLVTTDVTLSPIDFDKQACSSAPSVTQDLVVTNYSMSTLTVTAAPKPGSAFALAGSGSVSVAGGSATAPTTGQITFRLNPIGASVGTITEDVQVVVGANPPLGMPDDGQRTTPARVDVRGAILTATPDPLVGFQSYCGFNSCSADQKTFTITNAGNDPVNVAYSPNRLAGPRAWIESLPSTLNPGANGAQMYFQPQASCATCEIQYSFLYLSGATLCSPPAVMDFQGKTN